ncbi:hypothetical protein D2Q93_14800 [Alicyclobacillaceae bacterium I2511]|nr:hypothetical protein D2Q93_14800 [Alicyclobacillaceae bacterium I2511]
MIVANVDTLVAHLDIPDYESQCGPYLDFAKEQEVSEETTTYPYRGIFLQTYPDRNQGRWHAVKSWIRNEDEKEENAISIEWRFNEKRSSHESIWPIEVIYRSRTCWARPFNELWGETIKVLQHIVADQKRLYTPDGELAVHSRISRVDIAVDSDEFQFIEKDRERFICRGRKTAAYETQRYTEETASSTYHSGQVFTGFTFGTGKIHVRIYNKFYEIMKKQSYKEDKHFFRDIWKSAGWDTDRDVWRTEVQLRREALRDFQYMDTEQTIADVSVFDAMAQAGALLPYLLGSWITLRQPTSNKNRSEWPLDPAWETMVNTVEATYGTTARLHLPPQFDRDRLAVELKGYLTAYAVAAGESSSRLLTLRLLRLLAQTFNREEIEMEDWMDAEIAKKAATTGRLLAKKKQIKETPENEILLDEFSGFDDCARSALDSVVLSTN